MNTGVQISTESESPEITIVSISRDLVESLKNLENATIYLVSTRFSWTHQFRAPIEKEGGIVSWTYRIIFWIHRIEARIKEMSLYNSHHRLPLTAWLNGMLKDINRVDLSAGLLQDDGSQTFYATIGKDLEGRDLIFNFDYREIYRLLHDPKDNAYFIWLDE